MYDIGSKATRTFLPSISGSVAKSTATTLPNGSESVIVAVWAFVVQFTARRYVSPWCRHVRTATPPFELFAVGAGSTERKTSMYFLNSPAIAFVRAQAGSNASSGSSCGSERCWYA